MSDSPLYIAVSVDPVIWYEMFDVLMAFNTLLQGQVFLLLFKTIKR